MGNKVEAMQKKCKALSKLQSLPEEIQLKCKKFILSADKTFKTGYLLDSDIEKDQADQKELDRYLKLLRSANKDRESILVMLDREEKKALKDKDRELYTELKQSQTQNVVSRTSILDRFKNEVNSKEKSSQYNNDTKYNDFIIRSVPKASKEELAKKIDKNNRKIVAEALKDLEKQIEQSKRSKVGNIQPKEEKQYTKHIYREQNILLDDSSDTSAINNESKPSSYIEEEERSTMAVIKRDSNYFAESKTRYPSFIFSISVVVSIIILILLWIRKKKTYQEIKNNTSSSNRRISAGTRQRKKIDLRKSNELLYDPLVISDKLGLPVEMIKEFAMNYKSHALSIKEQLYKELQQSYQKPKKDSLNKLITDADDLDMQTLLTLLLSIQSEKDIQVKKRDLDAFYILVNKI